MTDRMNSPAPLNVATSSSRRRLFPRGPWRRWRARVHGRATSARIYQQLQGRCIGRQCRTGQNIFRARVTRTFAAVPGISAVAVAAKSSPWSDRPPTDPLPCRGGRAGSCLAPDKVNCRVKRVACGPLSSPPKKANGGASRKSMRLEGKRMASGDTGNVVPRKGLWVRVPCPPLVHARSTIPASAG